jgi:hypothetical protein
MSEEKVRVSVIDFMPLYGKVMVGKDKNGVTVHYGDTVKYNNENWLIAYRYGNPMLKQIGMMAMIGNEKFKEGDFSNVERQDIFAAGPDWLIIGYENDPLIEKVQSLLKATT